ncbi:MAG TPA: alpha/beta hydrolase [Herpetosiphonaceae bacterium]
MSNWVEADVAANDIRIHYHRTGTAGKPALLLLHGVTDSGQVWARVARELADDYDIIMTDARGHGRSDNLATGFSIPMLADDAAGVISALALDKPYVWGHSMGAITAAALAASYPELVRAAVLEDPPLKAADADQASTGQKQNPSPPRLAFPDFRAMSAEERITTAAAMNPTWHADELPPWAESKALFDPTIAQHFTAFQSYPWREVLARIECPALLVTGDPEAGAIVTPAVAQEAAALLRQGRIAHIAGSGHNIHRERYEQTIQAIREFLNEY